MNLEDMKKAVEEFKHVKATRLFDDAEAALIAKNYSVTAVIRSLIGDRSADDGFEKEIDAEIRRRDKRSAGGVGFCVPYCVLNGVRAMDTTDGAGAIATDHRPDLYINPLSAKCVVAKSGAQVIDGLVGDVSIPKGENVEAYWVNTEGGDATEVTPEIGNVRGTPHTCAAFCDVTRKLAEQSSPEATGLVSKLIIEAVARAVDKAAFAGTGTNGQPKGLLNIDGINVITGITPGKPTRANVEAFVAALEGENVVADNLRWLCPAPVKGCLAGTLDYMTVKDEDEKVVAAASAARYLYEKGLVSDLPLTFSGLCPAKKLWLGDWSHLYMLGWGQSVTLNVDPYSLSKSGGIRIVVLKDVDIVVAQPKAFAVGDILA